MNTNASAPARTRPLVLLGAVLLALLALPATGLAQSSGEEPPPPADPLPEPQPPVVEIPELQGPTTITLKVPPPPAQRAAPKVIVVPVPERARPPAPAPRSYTPEPEPAYVPEPEPAYSPAAEPEPAAAAPARKAKPQPKPKPKVRKPKKRPAAPPAPAEAIKPALPVVTLVEERRPFVAALPPPPYVSGDQSTAPLYLLFLLALSGTLLLGVAGAAPRLAFYWPEVFVPVTRERDAVSFFGLCLLASGVLAWAIVGTGI